MRIDHECRRAGLRYVYAGNLPGAVGDLENTRCSSCSQALVERCGYHIEEYQVSPEGTCPSCGNRVPGRWDPRFGGQATDHPFSPYDRTRRLS